MSSAQRDLLPLDEASAETEAVTPLALREQVAQRLAAHRVRRTQRLGNPVPTTKPSASANTRSSRIAAAVAERYANSQSYRAFLAAQAETAIHEAEAAVDVAVLNAQAIADVQYQLLAELDQMALTQSTMQSTAAQSPVEGVVPAAPQSVNSGLAVWLYDAEQPDPRIPPLSGRLPSSLELENARDEEERLALDDEIAFRQSPTFEDANAPVDIPANLIEFPRQLVASRKARPRLAEGPLREEADHAAEAAQLRIFEVEAAQISTAPVVESVAPEWSSILLAAHPVSAPVETPEAPFQPVFSPQTAVFSLRLMASVADGCIVMAALLAFTAVFAAAVGRFSGHAAGSYMTLQTAAVGAVVTFAVLTLLYQLLFFTFSEATPGMRYARIALCSFADDNPTRSAMRRRILATVLAACPLGIGFLWAWMDDDGLGWHDRISRMYQRSY